MKSIGVFLSSADNVAPLFLSEAEAMGQTLAKAGYAVVYGGSNTGCMGRLAQGVMDAHGTLIGVVPEMDFLEGLVQDGLAEKILVRDLAERKNRMIERSDAFLVLPGGLGTLDEISDVLALRQIGVHQKPVIFYNTFAYWTPLIECLETFHQQRMITKAMEDLFVVLDRPSDVIRYLNTCVPN